MKNPFGKAKLNCSKLFKKWAKTNNKNFINLVIPNIFGPFGKPNYNSFIATFCNNLIFNRKSTINGNSKINLLYVDDLIKTIISSINEPTSNIIEVTEFDGIISTSVIEVFEILKNQWKSYNSNNIIPNISTKFELNLFNTLRSFIPYQSFFPKKLIKHTDERGFFSEIIKTKGEGQFSFSTTFPAITRGNHFHTRKIERFIVIEGKALVEMRKIDTNDKLSFILKAIN